MRLVRQLHKWLGLLLALQFLLWAISGTVFAWLDDEAVAAEATLRWPPQPVLPVSLPLREPRAWLHEYGTQPVRAVALVALEHEWFWRVELAAGVELRRAGDGRRYRPDAARIRRLAQQHYGGAGTLQQLTLLPQGEPVLRTTDPLWRAQFDDTPGTTFYFAADDGRLLRTRNRATRLFDFFWMLHTMDYSTRGDFNNPLVITAGMLALWLSGSGVLLLLRSLRRG